MTDAEKPDLSVLCAEWQERLHLMDWSVCISYCRARGLSIGNTQGVCEWVLAKKCATIAIMDPIDYPENECWPQDIEKTVVHELLHLHLAPWTPAADTLETTMEEQAIEAISDALVKAKRGNE